MAELKTDLRQQLLRAAIECSEGNPQRTFSSEELLLAAWKREPASWGLRGHEREHPDSHRVHRELDSRGKDQRGIVGSGFLEKVGPRTYRITPKGLAAVSSQDGGGHARERTNRVLEAEMGALSSTRCLSRGYRIQRLRAASAKPVISGAWLPELLRVSSVSACRSLRTLFTRRSGF